MKKSQFLREADMRLILPLMVGVLVGCSSSSSTGTNLPPMAAPSATDATASISLEWRDLATLQPTAIRARNAFCAGDLSLS